MTPSEGDRRRTGVVLLGCAGALAVVFGGMLGLGDLTERPQTFVALFGLASLAYGVAVFKIAQGPPEGRLALAGIVGAAILFRLILLPGAPTLSHDVYRYLWDGRVSMSGRSPYRYPPTAPELADLRDSRVYPKLTHRDWRTIYPPGAQLLFAGVAAAVPGSPRAFKAVVVGFDLLTLGLLIGWLRALGRPATACLVYAWHPLVLVELAGSGHLDGVVLAATVAGLWAATRARDGWAGMFVGFGGLIKLYPALLLVVVAARRPWRTVAAGAIVGLAGYALYARDGVAVLGSLPRYVAEESFNSGLRLALDVGLASLGVPVGLPTRALALVVMAMVMGWVGLWGRHRPVAERALWVTGAWLVTAPSLFPWYALWLVPILAVRLSWSWLYLTCSVGLAYLILAQPVWHLPVWVVAVEYGPPAIGLAVFAVSRVCGAMRQAPMPTRRDPRRAGGDRGATDAA